MGELIDLNSDKCENIELAKAEGDLAEITKGVLLDIHTDIAKANSISMPIAELATLGAGISSLIPALQTVTQKTTINMQGLYRLANADVGDALKVAKNGNFWGAFKTAEGGSKFAQLAEADSLSATSTAVMPINSATMMMAVALFSIEQRLSDMAEMEKQILSFLELEKQAEIEADVETLHNITTKYKYNWDNEHFIASNHKMVLDIQRTARKNMISYQKKIDEILCSKQILTAWMKVDAALKDMRKKFQYYRLSLYTYAMASLIEILLSGNFKEENISGIISEIEKFSMEYRDKFMQSSTYLEKLSKHSVGANVLKGAGTASKAVGRLIGRIPVVKEGPVDEFLQKGGTKLKENARGMEEDILKSFAKFGNPRTGIFTNKMRDMIQIYNHTSEICFDEKKIYLITR